MIGPRMTRYTLRSKHNYFAMKTKPWFSKWCSNEVLGEGRLKAHPLETEAERYKRLALERGDVILGVLHCRLKNFEGKNTNVCSDPSTSPRSAGRRSRHARAVRNSDRL